MEDIIATSLEEFEALVGDNTSQEILDQYRVLFLTNDRVLVSYSDHYSRFYDDMYTLTEHITAYKNFNIAFEDEVLSTSLIVDDLIEKDTPLDAQCVLNESTILADFLNHWGENKKVREFIECCNQRNSVEKELVELPIEEVFSKETITESVTAHPKVEHDLPKSTEYHLNDYIAFQMYCNYIGGTITNGEYQLLLSHQDELLSMAQSHSLEYSIYTVLVEVAQYNVDNELLKGKLLLLDNLIVKVYDGVWHLYEDGITHENIQAYRVNCIDITGEISVYDVSTKNYTALKDKTETLMGLYNLCKSVNEGNIDMETTTIMFSSQPPEKPNRCVFCQEILRQKNSLNWQLVKVTMAGTLAECINYKDYNFEPIVLKSSFIRGFIQKDNIIEESLLPKMVTYDKEFLIIRNHTVVYRSLVEVLLTKDVCKSLLTLVECFQIKTNKAIQLNDTIMVKKVNSQQALVYQYLGCNNFKKLPSSGYKM